MAAANVELVSPYTKTQSGLCSRKDVRDAIGTARGAFGGWSARAAFNRGQILYRIAEMLEGRKAQFIEELMLQGSSKVAAEKEVNPVPPFVDASVPDT